MGKRKARAEYNLPKKRKFIANQFSCRSAESNQESENADSDGSCHEDTQSNSSFDKIRRLSFLESDNEEDAAGDEEQESGVNGNRIIYLSVLSDLILSAAVCRSCKKGNLVPSQNWQAWTSTCFELDL